MPRVVTAAEIARDLDVDATTFRRWLRSLANAGYPSVRHHKPWGRWTFSATQAADLQRLYLEQKESGRRSRELYPSVFVRFQGTEAGDLQLGELADFADALATLVDVGLHLRPDGESEPEPPILRYLRVGSPINLELIFPAGPFAAVGTAVTVRYVVGILNDILGGRADRAKTAADREAAIESAQVSRERAASIRAETRRTEAETDAVQATILRTEAETQALKVRMPKRLVELPQTRALFATDRVYVEDRAGILEGQTSVPAPDGASLEQAAGAIHRLTVSRVELDQVTIGVAGRKRRTRRKRP
jgi:hypothetical protein